MALAGFLAGFAGNFASCVTASSFSETALGEMAALTMAAGDCPIGITLVDCEPVEPVQLGHS